MKIKIARSRPLGGLRAAMSDQLAAKSGDARIDQMMMTKTSGKLRTSACSVAVAPAATHAGARARAPAVLAPAAPGALPLLARGLRGPRRGGRGAREETRARGRYVQPRPKQGARSALAAIMAVN
eukprot:9494739-Pyramimonas_sp.AAC.2